MSASPPTTGKALRAIPVAVGGPDRRATDVTNANWLLTELTSSRRLSTLARLPTKDEIMGAIGAIADWKRGRGDDAERCANALRALCSEWTPTVDVPHAISEAARALALSLGALEPPCGWDSDTGYPDVWDTVADMRDTSHTTKRAAGEKPTAGDTPAPRDLGADVSRRAARMAQAMAQALNLAGAFASPRMLAKATAFPSGKHVLDHLDALADVFPGSSIDNDAIHGAFARLRAGCANWTPGPQAPPEVQEAARALLAAFGFPEPPGGWDAFEALGEESGPHERSGAGEP